MNIKPFTPAFTGRTSTSNQHPSQKNVEDLPAAALASLITTCAPSVAAASSAGTVAMLEGGDGAAALGTTLSPVAALMSTACCADELDSSAPRAQAPTEAPVHPQQYIYNIPTTSLYAPAQREIQPYYPPQGFQQPSSQPVVGMPVSPPAYPPMYPLYPEGFRR